MTTPSPEKFFDVRITQRVDFADDLWMIRVVPAQEFHFAPGQYATLGVDNGQGLVERAYSIVSSPHEPEIEFFFELVPQGALTPLLYKLGPGDTITARKVAKGRFTLDTASGRTNHLLLCTVTGVAPFVSYARALQKQWKEGTFDGRHKLFVVQGASQSRELGYREELQQAGRRGPVAHLRPDRQPAVGRPGLARRNRESRRRHPQVRRRVESRYEYDDRVSLRPSRHDRARQGDPAASRLEERGASRRGLLHHQARLGRVRAVRA